MASKLSRLKQSLLETTLEMHRRGLMDTEGFEEFLARHLGAEPTLLLEPLTPEQIRAIRERENLSPAAFARRLNLIPGYISQLEKGVKRPTGATLVVLNAIQRKGLEAIL